MKFTLSTDQSKAITGIVDTLTSDPSKHAIAVLTGAAGVGKSVVVGEIITALRKNDPMVCIELGAATHRAATVLQDMVGQDVSTAHKLFKLKPSVARYGKQELVNFGVVDMVYGSVVIIDEASMIGDKFLKAIVSTVKDKALKVLFVGDPYQLPPINDTCSLFDGSLPTYTLTTAHRQSQGNPILDMADKYREFIGGLRSTLPELRTDINVDGMGIHVLPHEDFVSSFVKKYMSYDTGAVVDTPICTYTNASAINYNSMIRKAAYFLEDTIQPFYKGERLISNGMVRDGDTTILSNNEAVTVQSYATYLTAEGISGYQIRVAGTYNSFKGSNLKTVFSPINKAAADKVLKELKQVAVDSRDREGWMKFYGVKNYLADLRPPFAGTVHKSQGGTFPAVFIDQVNINKCRDPIVKARLLYVALTRASKNVYINS